MALSPTQKQWVIGGSIAAAAAVLGYELLHRRVPAGHLHDGRHGHDRHAGNSRGEYGHHRHHGGHHHK